jgi:predicted Zn-dependent peptidase
MEYQTHRLANGIRFIHKQMSSPVCHAALMLNTGSRDEQESEQGMAHFIEHVIFKGTRKRKAYHVISRLEDIGGELNAYTAKEETCIHASFMTEYLPRTLELFTDILFNSTFPAKELEKEKEVILDEFNSYQDSPSEQIFDDFDELIYTGHPLGKNILGTPETLKSFDRSMVLNFIEHNYFTDEMVICTIGNIPFVKALYQIEKYFASIPSRLKNRTRIPFTTYSPKSEKAEKDTYQSHCLIGRTAYTIFDNRKTGLYLLSNWLAGPGLNSRLNLSLREKHGLVYNVESSYVPYTDTGLFSIYFGTDQANLKKSLRIVQQELRLLREKKLGDLQLHRAKRQLIGQLAISAENLVGLNLSMAKSYLTFDRVDSLAVVNQKIEQVSASELLEIANEILVYENFSHLIYS